MCRLYGFRSTHPGPVECELLGAQNALVHQSRRDSRGLSNLDGWGIGMVERGAVRCVRQAGPAFESDEFREEARRASTAAVVAHVRRATVGGPRLVNTHPFRSGDELLAHNGHIGSFARLKPKLLERLSPESRRAIAGDTDSEHLFHLLLTRARRDLEAPRTEILARTVREVEAWVDGLGVGGEGPAAAGEADGSASDGVAVNETVVDEREVALNVLWLRPGELVGSRSGRSLWYVERDAPHVCEVHGTPHVVPPAGEPYRAVVVASDPITEEEWTPLPDRCVFRVSPDLRLRIRPLEAEP